MQTEVLIVGAGPTGLSLAAQFIRCGVDFVIVDKKDGVTELSKALAVHARTLEIYDQIGLAREAVGRGAVIHKGAIHHDGKVRAELDLTDFGQDLSPFPFVLTLEQSKNERLLYEFLQANGKEVWWQTELESLAQDDAGVTAAVKSASGERQPISAKYVVGCDGAGSKTRHLLNLNFEGVTDARLFYVADVVMESELNHETLHIIFGSDAFALLFPMAGEKHWRLLGNLPEFVENERENFDYETIENKFKALAQMPLDITDVRWFSTYKVHTRHAGKFSNGRGFLAGDAAHIHTPAGGQGMNTGIQDAYNLAWKMALVLKHQADTSLLDSYNEERLANAKKLLRTTDEAFDFGTGEEWYFRFFREKILPNLAKFALQFKSTKQFVFPLISQIGINYRNASLSGMTNEYFKVQTGDRMPYFQIEGASVYDKLREPKFHFLIFNDGQNDMHNLKIEIETEFADLIVCETLPMYPKVTEIFGRSESFGVLLRPDNHIGFYATADDAAGLKNYLAQNVKLV